MTNDFKDQLVRDFVEALSSQTNLDPEYLKIDQFDRFEVESKFRESQVLIIAGEPTRVKTIVGSPGEGGGDNQYCVLELQPVDKEKDPRYIRIDFFFNSWDEFYDSVTVREAFAKRIVHTDYVTI